MINKETYFDFIEKKLNRITRGQDLTFGELDECFYKLNSLKKDYLILGTHYRKTTEQN